jgi:hypothetical protein
MGLLLHIGYIKLPIELMFIRIGVSGQCFR